MATIDSLIGFACAVLEKSARTNDRRKAERLAAKLEEELRSGNYFEPCKITWKEFRDLFDEIRLPNLRPKTGACYDSTFNRVEQLVNPGRLSRVNSMVIARFQNKLREIGNAEATICRHLRHLKAALRWAKRMNLIAKVPEIQMPKAGKHQRLMKGRPVTPEEFQRMLDVTEEVVGSESAASWRFLLEGLWWSGCQFWSQFLGQSRYQRLLRQYSPTAAVWAYQKATCQGKNN